MKIAFNPSTVAALIAPPNNKDVTFDLRGHNIFARGVKFQGTDTWRPVVDNLTSDSTTSSLSANQGRILKALIDGKSDSEHTHDDRYLKLTGGTMASNALITFADSGSWSTGKGPQGARGGLYWTRQSDYAKLYAEETAGDSLNLVIQFGDDNSNGLSIRNASNVQTSYISAGGVITTGTFKGNLDWSYITNKPATATRWPSWDEIANKPNTFTPSDHNHDGRYVRAGVYNSGDLNTLDTYSFIRSVDSKNKDTSPKGDIGWYNVIQLVHRNGDGDGSGYIGQIALGMTINTNDMFFRGKRTDSWKTVIHSGNIGNQTVASATKLATARSIWGQSFDGTADVNGSLSNTGTITASAAATYDIGSNTLDYRYGYFQWIGAKSNTNLRLAANNSDNQIVLHTNGNVGIGTTNPSSKLTVDGEVKVSTSLWINNSHFFKQSGTTFTCQGGTTFTLPSSALNTSTALLWTTASDGARDTGIFYNSSDFAFIANSNDHGAVFAVYDTDITQDFEAGAREISVPGSGGALWARGGFSKSGSSNDYVLLGGGGHKLESALNVANADTVDGYHADNIQSAGWRNLYRTGGSSKVIKWTRIGRCITTAINNTQNDGMIEFHTNGDQNYKYFGYGRLQISQYGQSSRSLMLYSFTSEGIHFYATIDEDNYIWLGHNSWWSGNSAYRVIWSGSYIEWYSSGMSMQTSNPNSVYVTDNGTFKKPNEAGFVCLNNVYVEASKLKTARKIWGQSFDGTADVNGTIYINNGDSSNGAIRLNNNVNSNARISAISDQVTFNTGSAIRFGETAWDFNQWAGLKYTHSNKTIYLGIADNSIFNANSAQSGGTLNLRAGISNIDLNSGTSIRGLPTNGSPYSSSITLRDASIYLSSYGDISMSTGPGTINLTAGQGAKASIGLDFKIESSRGVYLNSGNSGNVWLCQGGGNVSIGYSSPSYKLDVNGQMRASGFIHSDHSINDAVLLAGGGYGRIFKSTTKYSGNTYVLSFHKLSSLCNNLVWVDGHIQNSTSTSFYVSSDFYPYLYANSPSIRTIYRMDGNNMITVDGNGLVVISCSSYPRRVGFFYVGRA